MRFGAESCQPANTRFELTAEDSLAVLGSSVRSLRSPAPQPQR